ncbi:hypothetical protein Drorol1_Dr00013317 [Drosera rotundifolia]
MQLLLRSKILNCVFKHTTLPILQWWPFLPLSIHVSPTVVRLVTPPTQIVGGGGGGGRGSSSRGRNTNSCGRGQSHAAPITGDASSVYCYRCGYPYHKSNNCQAPTSSIAAAKVFTALHIGNQSDSNWYPDTGASHHMTPDSSSVAGAQDREGSTVRP